MTVGGDGWIPSDDDDPKAPPKPPDGMTADEAEAFGVAPEAPSHIRLVQDDERGDPPWARALAMGGGENPKPTKDAGNVAIILSHASCWRGIIRHNALADRVLIGECPPLPHLPAEWVTLTPPKQGDVTQQHDVYAGLWLRRQWRQSWSDGAVRSGIVYAAQQNAFNPLTDYLDASALAWDGKARLDEWLCTYLGVERSVYAMRVGAMWIISAVARAYEPGCKVDHVLVLEGSQGLGKTSALELLFGSEWFLPELPDLTNKDAMHLLAGVSCALIDELCAMRGNTLLERAKSFLTRRIDIYRPPYGKDAVRRLRTAIFAATTNAHEYLFDESGGRRFWSVICRELARQALADDRDQLWGEAVARYRLGELWYPARNEPDIANEIKRQQEKRFVADAWEESLAKHAASLEYTTTREALVALGVEPADMTPAKQAQCSRALRRLGLEQHSTRIDGAAARRWYTREAWVRWTTERPNDGE